MHKQVQRKEQKKEKLEELRQKLQQEMEADPAFDRKLREIAREVKPDGGVTTHFHGAVEKAVVIGGDVHGDVNVS